MAAFWLANLAYRPTVWTVLGTVSVLCSGFGCFFLLTGKWKTSLGWLTLIGLGLWLLNSGKHIFWKDFLKFEDLTIFADPANFETLLHYPLESALAGFLVCVLLFLCKKTFGVDSSCARKGRRLFVSLFSIALGVAGACVAFQNGQQQWMVNIVKGSNVVANLLMSSRIHYVSPAANLASKEHFPTVITTNGDRKEKSDIVLILQESTFNPRRLKGVDPRTLPKLEMFDSPWSTESGALRVHTYRGGTWRSEFSALTGLSSDDFGVLAGTVFYSAVFHLQDSLWSRLKKAGYRIIVVTPFAEGSYNSGKAYRALGADKIIHVTDLGWKGSRRKNIWNIPTGKILEMVRTVLDEKYDRPVAIYALTMKEHGPYPEKENHRLEADESNVGSAALGRVAQYVDRLEQASEDVVKFDRWVQERKRPTVLVRFGDHQPSLGWSGGYRTTQARPEYITDYTLVDNQVKGRERSFPLTDIVFLPSLILQHAGVPLGPFYETTAMMRDLCQGRYQDCPDSRLLKAYQNEIYVNQAIAK